MAESQGSLPPCEMMEIPYMPHKRVLKTCGKIECQLYQIILINTRGQEDRRLRQELG